MAARPKFIARGAWVLRASRLCERERRAKVLHLRRLRKRKGLAFGVLVLPLPLLAYVILRFWVGSEPRLPLLWLAAVVLIASGVALMWLLRRKSMFALVASVAYFGITFGSCGLALWHGERLARTACEDAVRLPMGEHVATLRELATTDGVTCAVGDLVSGSWYMLVQAGGLNIGSMWFVLDDDDEFVLRRVTLERSAIEGL